MRFRTLCKKKDARRGKPIPGFSFNFQLSTEDPDSVGTVDPSLVISHG